MYRRIRDLFFWTLGWRSGHIDTREEIVNFNLNITRQATFDLNINSVTDFDLNVEEQVTVYSFDLSINRVHDFDLNICRMKEFDLGC